MKGIDDLDDCQGLFIYGIGIPWTTSERAAPEWDKLQTKRHSDKKLEGAIRAWTHLSFGWKEIQVSPDLFPSFAVTSLNDLWEFLLYFGLPTPESFENYMR